jgi:CDP-diacylglycerol--serine O-phosphatidyltransferase
MREHVNPANLLTSGSLAAGFVALLLAADGRLQAAAVAVALAVALDASDGFVARAMGCGGRFGTNLDSLADLVAFGVAPAFVLQRAADADAASPSGAAGTLFVLASAWRLARFPLVADRLQFVGVPVPVAGLALVGAVAAGLPAGAATGLALVLAALMVSSVPFPTLHTAGRIIRGGRRRGLERRRRLGAAVRRPTRRRRPATNARAAGAPPRPAGPPPARVGRGRLARRRPRA